jgi:hypothetical protein
MTFLLQVFSWINFPRTPKNNIRVTSQIFLKIRENIHKSRCMGTLSDCWHLKVNYKEQNYLYVNSTTQRCPNKTVKTFLIEDFSHFPPVSLTQVVHLELRNLREISKKFETAMIVPSGAWEKRIHEENLKSKISWKCPFKNLRAGLCFRQAWSWTCDFFRDCIQLYTSEYDLDQIEKSKDQYLAKG